MERRTQQGIKPTDNLFPVGPLGPIRIRGDLENTIPIDPAAKAVADKLPLVFIQGG